MEASQSGVDVDYKAKYEELFAACGNANGDRKKLLTAIAKDLGALLKVICEPDPPGCSGPIPADKLTEILVKVQQANALKRDKVEVIITKVNEMMAVICVPDPPGCNGGN